MELSALGLLEGSSSFTLSSFLLSALLAGQRAVFLFVFAGGLSWSFKLNDLKAKNSVLVFLGHRDTGSKCLWCIITPPLLSLSGFHSVALSPSRTKKKKKMEKAPEAQGADVCPGPMLSSQSLPPGLMGDGRGFQLKSVALGGVNWRGWVCWFGVGGAFVPWTHLFITEHHCVLCLVCV